jgi:hypothetical protein
MSRFLNFDPLLGRLVKSYEYYEIDQIYKGILETKGNIKKAISQKCFFELTYYANIEGESQKIIETFILVHNQPMQKAIYERVPLYTLMRSLFLSQAEAERYCNLYYKPNENPLDPLKQAKYIEFSVAYLSDILQEGNIIEALWNVLNIIIHTPTQSFASESFLLSVFSIFTLPYISCLEVSKKLKNMLSTYPYIEKKNKVTEDMMQSLRAIYSDKSSGTLLLVGEWVKELMIRLQETEVVEEFSIISNMLRQTFDSISDSYLWQVLPSTDYPPPWSTHSDNCVFTKTQPAK